MIKVVFIDVDNTLLDFEKGAELSIKKAFKDFELPFEKQVVETFHKINDGLWHNIEKGELTREGLFAIRWKLIFSELDIPFDGPTMEKQFFSYLTNSTVPIDGALKLLKYLAPKYTLCVTSNAGYNQQTRRLETAGMLRYINHVFVSEKIGIAKPDKGFFDACFAEFNNITPSETIIIGDSLTADIGGGKKYGMKTCWYNHKKAFLNETVDSDYVVNSLKDIEKIL